MSAMRTSWRGAVVVLLAALASGCYESDFPLDPEPRHDVDPALIAVWRCLPMDAEPTEAAATLTITRGTAPRTFAAIWQDEGDTPDRYDGFASSLDGVVYLNVRERADGGREHPWFFMRPTLLRPNALHLQVVAEAAMSGVEKTPAAVRAALIRRRADTRLLTDGALCARARPAP